MLLQNSKEIIVNDLQRELDNSNQIWSNKLQKLENENKYLQEQM